MIEEVGKVVAVNGEQAWVETIRQSACDACSAKSGCGHSTLAKLGQKSHHIQANCEVEVAVGDQVVVGVPEDIMIRSSMLAYLVPLIAMLILSIVADHLWANELLTAISAASGLGLGFMVLRWHFNRFEHDPRYQPVVLRHFRSTDSVVHC